MSAHSSHSARFEARYRSLSAGASARPDTGSVTSSTARSFADTNAGGPAGLPLRRGDGVQQPAGRLGHVVDRFVERLGVGPRRHAVAAHLAHVLQRGLLDLPVGGRLVGPAEDLDAPAHGPEHARTRAQLPPTRCPASPIPGIPAVRGGHGFSGSLRGADTHAYQVPVGRVGRTLPSRRRPCRRTPADRGPCQHSTGTTPIERPSWSAPPPWPGRSAPPAALWRPDPTARSGPSPVRRRPPRRPCARRSGSRPWPWDGTRRGRRRPWPLRSPPDGRAPRSRPPRPRTRNRPRAPAPAPPTTTPSDRTPSSCGPAGAAASGSP